VALNDGYLLAGLSFGRFLIVGNPSKDNLVSMSNFLSTFQNQRPCFLILFLVVFENANLDYYKFLDAPIMLKVHFSS
jgi:hypothetical protein